MEAFRGLVQKLGVGNSGGGVVGGGDGSGGRSRFVLPFTPATLLTDSSTEEM